jgi:hypothetical protein
MQHPNHVNISSQKSFQFISFFLKIILNSMHRYIPRLHIVQATDTYSMRTGPLSTFIFDETVFIAVTAYQNDQVRLIRNFNPIRIIFFDLDY